MAYRTSGSCELGVGCDESGACYALYCNEPERCGRPECICGGEDTNGGQSPDCPIHGDCRSGFPEEEK